MTRAAYILHGARTAFTKAGTDFKAVPATDLGRAAAVEAMARSGVEPGEIDQAIFGNIATPPDAANIGRVIALRAGIPKERPAHSVSRNCASGIESIVQAARLIQTGEADVVLAGGVENMSLIPFLYRERVKAALAEIGMARTTGARIAAFAKMPWSELLNPVIGLKLGLTDPVCGLNMGETAELLAKEDGITRETQDAFALRSHQRAQAAREKLAEEIVPVPLPPGVRQGRHARQRRPREPVDRGAREAEALLRPEVRHRHGGELLADHRRRGRGRRRLGGVRREAEALGPGPDRRLGLRGPRARADGPRPVALDARRPEARGGAVLEGSASSR